MASVSYVIPLYNQGEFLLATARSLQEQSYQDWEAVIVDDGSTDESSGIAGVISSKDCRFRLLKQENSGVAVARNTGLEAARGDFLVFLDSDDVVFPCHAAALLEMLADSGADVAVGSVAKTDQMLRPFAGEESNHLKIETRLSAGLLEHNPMHRLSFQGLSAPHSAMFTRRCFESLRFQPEIPGNEDWLVFCKCALAGRLFRTVPSTLGYYRIHPESITRNAIRQYDSRERAIRNFDAELKDPVSAAAITLTRWMAWNLVGRDHQRPEPVPGHEALDACDLLRSTPSVEPYATLYLAGHLNRLVRAGRMLSGLSIPLAVKLLFSPSCKQVVQTRLSERGRLGNDFFRKYPIG